MPHTVNTAVNVTVLSKNNATADRHPDDVFFKVDYKPDYTGPKHFVNGKVTVMNKDVAADFANRGIGFICSEDGAPLSADTFTHIVTDTDLENNPDLAEHGVKAGDEIEVPVAEAGDEIEVPVAEALKKDKGAGKKKIK